MTLRSLLFSIVIALGTATEARPGDPLWDLYLAVQNGKVMKVESLMRKVPDVNFRYRDGETLLMLAASNGDVNIGRILLRHKARLNDCDRLGLTPLCLAILANRAAMVSFLLSAGADVDGCPNGVPPIVAAADHRQQGMVNKLLGLKARVNQADPFRETALMKTALRGDLRIVKMLLASGADKTLKNFRGQTARMLSMNVHNRRLRIALQRLL